MVNCWAVDCWHWLGSQTMNGTLQNWMYCMEVPRSNLTDFLHVSVQCYPSSMCLTYICTHNAGKFLKYINFEHILECSGTMYGRVLSVERLLTSNKLQDWSFIFNTKRFCNWSYFNCTLNRGHCSYCTYFPNSLVVTYTMQYYDRNRQSFL